MNKDCTQRTAELLSGKWLFTPEGEKVASTIHVPSQWTHGECLGYPEQWKKVVHATYERTINLPCFDPAKRCGIAFEAVMLSCEVFVDGTKIGGHKGGFTPFETLLPDKLWRRLSGMQAVLRVEVSSAKTAFTENGVIHQVGYPDDGEEGAIPGGIWQNVWLFTRPKLHISSWQSDYKHASRTLDITVDVLNSSKKEFAGIALVRIGSSTGAVKFEIPVLAAAGNNGVLSGTVRMPEAFGEWSTHTPELHQISIRLISTNGVTVDTTSDRIGLREVKLSGDAVIINGNATRLFGISLIRHRVAPYLWHRDYLTLYFKTLKSLGFNALRLHAAIAPKIVLDIADETGIMLINQSSVWSTVVYGYSAGGRTFIENTKQEYTEWFVRDRNHPSVIVWDVENEQIGIDEGSITWVNELVAHMRTLTAMPVCISSGGLLGDDDFIHIHCFSAYISRMLRGRNFDSPFIAGEWWGPNREYHNTIHAPLCTPDPYSVEHQLSELGMYYQREIIAQRVNGAAGTFPFALEILLFRPLFTKNDRIKVKSGSADMPYFDRAEEFTRDGNWHVTRRLLVNPGWNDEKPRVKFSPTARLIKKALAPLLIAPVDTNTDFYGNDLIQRKFVLCNDTGIPLNAAISATLLIGKKQIKCVIKTDTNALNTGRNTGFLVSFTAPEVNKIENGCLIIKLTTATGCVESKTDIRLWPAIAGCGSTRMPLMVMGGDNALCSHLKRFGYSFSKTETLPEKPCVLLACSLSATVNSSDVEHFINTGGRIILLRQNKAPNAMPVPFKFKSAQTAIRPVLKGLINDERELFYAERVPVTAPLHPVGAALPLPVLQPFAAGDHRVVDDVYTHLLDSGVDIDGSYTVIMEGVSRAQISLAEVRYGQGMMLLCQLFLKENLGIDPQADSILVAMINHANNFSASVKTLSCDSPRLAKWLSKSLQTKVKAVTEPEQLDGINILVITSKEFAVTALSASRSSALGRWLAEGGTCLISLQSAELPGMTIKKLKHDAIISDMTASHPLGLNSWSLNAARKAGVCGTATCTGRKFAELIRVWRRNTEDSYAGLVVGSPLGSLLLEQKVGKGRLLVAAIDLKRTKEKVVSLLWQALLSNFGMPVRCSVKTEDIRIIARPTVPIPMDGDINKWTNTEPDRNIAPWSRAVPVAFDERQITVMNASGWRKNSHGAVFYVLHDDANLYFAAKLVSDHFDFKDVETLRYECDSIEIRIKDVLIFVSIGKDGQPFLRTFRLRDGTSNIIIATATIFNDISGFTDIGLLNLDNPSSLKSLFFEVKIPFKALPYDAAVVTAGDCECCVAFNARTGTPPNRMQCSHPGTMQWDDPATYGILSFEK